MPFMTGNSRISAGIESAIQFTRGMARTSGPRGRVPAFVLLAAAVMATVVGPAAAQDLTSGTAVYGTGQAATDWTGGTISSGATLRLNDGATVSGVAITNGTLQFNQTGALTINQSIDSTGRLSLTNSGTLNLTQTTSLNAPIQLLMTTDVSAGLLQINSGTVGLVVSGNGTLLVNGSLANSAVIVGSGRTLGGSGTLGALATVQSGGVLSPGNSPGALAAAALDLQAGSTTFMQVIGSGSAAGVAGTDYDQVRITTSGGLTYGGSLDLNFGNATTFLNGTIFDLFAFTGSSVGHFSSVVSSGTGFYAGSSFSRTGANWTSTIGNQLLTFSELSGRLSVASSGGSGVPEIDAATGFSALSLLAGMLAILGQRLEQRRRRAKVAA